ncbi:MAG: PUA domain-containing protein [Candidatus Thermoplasmatota archaeon]|nr:PUA domain-containing protein [Candidatus Thermoplasmatota archaeon]
MVGNLVVKKRRPINKKEARRIKQGLLKTHDLDLPISAGNYELASSENFDVVIQYGHIIALILDDTVLHLSVRGLLSHTPQTGWIQVDMGAVPFLCNGANAMSAGINDVSPEVVEGQYVWIREENHHKPLAIGKAILSSADMLSSDRGKAVQALHYIGDKVWEYGVKD